jgi:tripartite-type tricarboxylate transporter receptor subunit TctC
VERLSAEIATSLNRPAVRDRLLEQGAAVVGANPTQTASFHRAELEKWLRAVQLSGARVE